MSRKGDILDTPPLKLEYTFQCRNKSLPLLAIAPVGWYFLSVDSALRSRMQGANGDFSVIGLN